MQPSYLALEQRRRAAARGRAQIMENRKRRRERWRDEAKVLWKQWREDPLFIMGVALYWGEGTKHCKEPILDLSNSDAGMLRVWLRWCRRFMPGVPLNFYLQLHDGCNEDAARLYWRSQLGIDVDWCRTAVSRASKRTRNTLPYGTLSVGVGRGRVEWYTKMLVWLELAREL